MTDSQKALRNVGIVILIELAIVVFFVWFFDPFYQYHAPFLGMEAVLNDRDNQVPGTIRSFQYDSVLAGSSLAENCDSGFLDEAYECHTLKLIKASGSTADLIYYLDMAHGHSELKNVFYCLDLAALLAPTETVLFGEDIPRYLHTGSVLDDGTYVFNKEVLLEKIPLMLAYGKAERNIGGHAYDWSYGKNFSAEQAMRAYDKPAENIPPIDFSQDVGTIQANLDLLVQEVTAHPDITYRFFIPVYSMLWWDCAKANGLLEEYLYVLEETLTALTPLPNVRLYAFQLWQETACDLDHYMDMIHYDPNINQRMLEAIKQGENLVTEETLQEYIDGTKAMVDYICGEGIYKYYE